MVVMGCQVLGNLNEPAIRPGKIGQELYNLVLATGTLALTFGVANIASSILFADRKAGINARMIRSDGNLAAAAGESDAISDLEEKRASGRWTRRFTLRMGTGSRLAGRFRRRRGMSSRSMPGTTGAEQDQPNPPGCEEAGYRAAPFAYWP